MTKPAHAQKGSPVDEKRADSTGSEDNSDKAKSKTTHIEVGVTAGTVHEGARVTGMEVGAIQGPVTINVTGPAVDPGATRRAAVAALRQPILPLRPFEPETIFIPAGPFRMGSDDPAAPAWERPQHTVTLPDFRIGKYPVTNAQYAEFVAQQEKPLDFLPPRQAGWTNLKPPDGCSNHPVAWVSWHQAVAYCEWLTRQTDRAYRLPTEAEWEKAAAPTPSPSSELGGGVYPWGDAWDEGRCNAGSNGTTPVTAHPDGASAYGVEDLLGNVEEWTSTAWGDDRNAPRYPYPYRIDDGREEPGTRRAGEPLLRLHRGGSYRAQGTALRCTARGVSSPTIQAPWRGFRVAMTV